MSLFLKAGDRVFAMDQIAVLDLSGFRGNDVVFVKLRGEDSWLTAKGFDAVEIIMVTKPTIAEGSYMRFQRHSWAFHNLVGHPVMQILSWLGFKKAAIRFHDWSAPCLRDYLHK